MSRGASHPRARRQRSAARRSPAAWQPRAAPRARVSRVLAATLPVALVLGGCARNYTGDRPPTPADTLELRVSDSRLEIGRVASPAMLGDLLQRVGDAVHDGAEIYLHPGHYVLEPVAYTDSSCGNCTDPDTLVPATVGLRLTGNRVRLVGMHADSVVIETRAGYGVLFENCAGCELRGVTVTGGARDPDARATNAAVVVKHSDVALRDCVLRDNIGDSTTVRATVVGVAGIVGREGSYVDVEDCSITRNSWDGIALYRGARARIHGNVIDGVDAATGQRVGGGRGVGIGVTWDADADVVGNRVSRYWKGIGVFVDGRARLRENVVEDILTWGIAVWGAGQGQPDVRIERNAVYRTGACGVMISAGTPPAAGADAVAAADSAAQRPRRDGARPGRPPARTPLGQPAVATNGTLIGNAVALAGRDERYDPGQPYCIQRPLALESVPAGFVVNGNLLYGNRQPGPAARSEQLTRSEFVRAIAPLLARLADWNVTRESSFVRDFTPAPADPAPADPAAADPPPPGPREEP